MNKKRSLIEYVCWFATIFGIYLLLSAIVLDLYSNYKVHEFIKYHDEEYIFHKYCLKINDYYACSDDYVINKD